MCYDIIPRTNNKDNYICFATYFVANTFVLYLANTKRKHTNVSNPV